MAKQTNNTNNGPKRVIKYRRDDAGHMVLPFHLFFEDIDYNEVELVEDVDEAGRPISYIWDEPDGDVAEEAENMSEEEKNKLLEEILRRNSEANDQDDDEAEEEVLSDEEKQKQQDAVLRRIREAKERRIRKKGGNNP